METVLCACGCGKSRPKYDAKGRVCKYVKGHQNKNRKRTPEQRAASAAIINQFRPRIPWNLGKSYVHASKPVYANKGAWNKAMRRLYPDKCMICGWDKASCDTHHILQRSSGGAYTLENGVILCPNCHRLAHSGILSIDDLKRAKDKVVIQGQIV